MILIDSCVLVDVLDGDPAWEAWSVMQLTKAALQGSGAINPVILAELHGRQRDLAWLARAFESYRIETVPLHATSSERAGAAFRSYRERGGRSGAILADFLIGAHAATLGAALLTRDRERFASYFPELAIIAPESDQP